MTEYRDRTGEMLDLDPEELHARRCTGWLGEDDEGRPRPCTRPKCKKHLAPDAEKDTDTEPKYANADTAAAVARYEAAEAAELEERRRRAAEREEHRRG